ncbi:chorion class A protein L12-like [Bombyx mandarina]|uniref:Chorion class A protein L12-like n=1 Tax=Bombyx mandarina TaxID=7092 RepID=A0A6J2KJM5_BOMMA|nr:chorion class A protein L12-like [Bombyx mandarina]
MSTFTFFLLCVQACLIQNVYSQYWGGLGGCGCGAGLGGLGLGYGAGWDGYGIGWNGLGAGWNGFDDRYGDGCGSYGGEGIGNVGVAGELPVGGVTAVGGRVPIIGGVEFGGPACAAGAVSICGHCAPTCGCGRGIY